jgi:hypothetical protein
MEITSPSPGQLPLAAVDSRNGKEIENDSSLERRSVRNTDGNSGPLVSTTDRPALIQR